MIRCYLKWITLSFWASPRNSIYDYLLSAGGWKSDRHMKLLDPGFPRDDPPVELPKVPLQPTPTDVPMPPPHDVPAPEPRDVPPPDPGKMPKPATSPRRQENDPKPRPVP